MANTWPREELAYCSNVHPAETLDSLNDVVSIFLTGVRNARQTDSIGAGLWISAELANQIIGDRQNLIDLADTLDRHKIKLFTLNGFPFGNFHAESVKEHVYTPDWSRPERLAYTYKLAEILAECLPADATEGTISTLPLGYRHSWSQQQHQCAVEALCELTRYLAGLRRRSGRRIRVCLEMEPDCVLETTHQMIDFFHADLRIQAQKMNLDAALIGEHLGVCFDVCHQAVMFETIAASMGQLLDAGIVIGKIQLSSALELKRPDRKDYLSSLGQFAEPKYLHQVRTLLQHQLIGAVDLPESIENVDFPRDQAWRIHFHVPIQSANLALEGLSTTQSAILDALDFLQVRPGCRPHLEVETYTWQVLPEIIRPRNEQMLIQGLTDELNWLEQQMTLRGLIENTVYEK